MAAGKPDNPGAGGGTAGAGALPAEAALYCEAARRLGWEAEVLDPEFGYLYELRADGHCLRLVGGRTPLNDASASRICEDKFYTELVLRRAGISTTESVRCLAPHGGRAHAWRGRGGADPGLGLARQRGYPLVIKPNRLSHGLGVQVVDSERMLRSAIEAAWQLDYCVLVQPRVGGVDLRLNFVDGEYSLGYARLPVEITGDGQRSIRELLGHSVPRFADEASWRRATKDPVWQAVVVDRGWDERTVVPPGAMLRFETAILNLNRWARAEVLPQLDHAWLALGRQIGTLLRLRHFGVDFKIPAAGARPEEATVIEVNPSPLLTQFAACVDREAALRATMRVLRACLDWTRAPG